MAVLFFKVYKKEKYIDLTFLVVLGLLLGQALYKHFMSDYNLSINTWVGFAGWVIVGLLRIFRAGRFRYAMLILLVTGMMNLVSFSADCFRFGEGCLIFYKGFLYNAISVNPQILLLFIIYVIINPFMIRILWTKVMSGSKKEQLSEATKEIRFYYNKFSLFEGEAWENVLNNFDEYPESAKTAITRIAGERREK